MIKALVVDDELEICLMVCKHLQKLGLETQYALTAKEARSKIFNSSCDVMFLDLNLPDSSGFDVIQYCNQMQFQTRIVVISAYDSEESKALEAGADLFLSKPFALKKINEKLESLNLLPRSIKT
jgi:DNA-binding response OmpR family regulator